MSLKVTAAGTVIGKANLFDAGASITSFTVNVPVIKANSMVFASKLDSSVTGSGGGTKSFSISVGNSFTQTINSLTAGNTVGIGWEIII